MGGMQPSPNFLLNTPKSCDTTNAMQAYVRHKLCTSIVAGVVLLYCLSSYEAHSSKAIAENLVSKKDESRERAKQRCSKGDS